MIAFEPGEKLAQGLSRIATQNADFFVNRIALGDKEEDAILHTTIKDGVYNSLNAANPEFAKDIAELNYTGSEAVKVKTLDGFMAAQDPNNLGQLENLLINIDTQGHDYRVLQGGHATIAKAKAVIIELPFKNIYQSQGTYRDIMDFMYQAGFSIYGISPIGIDDTGALVEADAFYVKL